MSTTPSFIDKSFIKILGQGGAMDGQQKVFVTGLAILAVWYVTDKVYGNKFTTPRAQFWSVFAILTLMIFGIITAQTGGIDPSTGGTRGFPFITANKTYYAYVLNDGAAPTADETSNGLHDTQVHMYHFILSAIIGIGISFAIKEFYLTAKKNISAVATAVNA